MKKPKFLSKLAAKLSSPPKKRYQVAARAARSQQIDDYDDDQPTTKLSSAFVVVLILHVVAVGGIYAFNSIKASRRSHDRIAISSDAAALAGAKTGEDADGGSAGSNTPVADAKPSHPASPVIAPVAAPAPAAPAPLPRMAGARQHQVKTGENATKIAFAYHMTSAELLSANGLKENAVLHVGQMLTIPSSKSEARTLSEMHRETPARLTDIPPTRTTPGLHVVKKGDTVHSIARSYGMSSEELIKLNRISDPKRLQLGQALKIPPRRS
jgi:LysM repeat protein